MEVPHLPFQPLASMTKKSASAQSSCFASLPSSRTYLTSPCSSSRRRRRRRFWRNLASSLDSTTSYRLAACGFRLAGFFASTTATAGSIRSDPAGGAGAGGSGGTWRPASIPRPRTGLRPVAFGWLASSPRRPQPPARSDLIQPAAPAPEVLAELGVQPRFHDLVPACGLWLSAGGLLRLDDRNRRLDRRQDQIGGAERGPQAAGEACRLGEVAELPLGSAVRQIAQPEPVPAGQAGQLLPERRQGLLAPAAQQDPSALRVVVARPARERRVPLLLQRVERLAPFDQLD